MGSNITAVFTSCDRHDLLKQTLDSFIRVQCGGSKPDACLIIEDGPTPMPEWFRENIHYYSSNLGKVEWISNDCRRGQIYSIDRAYAMVKTDYIFHCEDDWVFNQGHFMQDSKDLLVKYPQILQVSLRGDTGWHQLIDQPPFEGCKIAMPGWKGGWGGISFNPGLRRLSDYKRIGSYGKYVTYGTMGLGHEIALSKMHLDMGYRIADLSRPVVVHTGGTRSRMHDANIPLPKTLIAIPVCHKFSYGKWEGDRTNNCVAKDYHFNGDNDRVQAIRDTWLKDTKVFPNVTVRFFYGQPTPEGFVPKDDEVILSCPDDYAGLPAKTVEICKYAAKNGYEMLFKCDDDSLIYVDRILQESMTGLWDYAGYLNGKVCTGGTGYWLTSAAIKIIAQHATSTFHWAEDVTVSHFLFHHNIRGVHLSGHYTGRADHWFWPGEFDPNTLPSDASAIHAVQPHNLRAWYAQKEAR